MTKRSKQIIKFDFHCHTIKSDGKQNMDKMLKAAKKVGLDFLAITDHNASLDEVDFEKIYEKYGVRLIPGFELSLARGHFLIIGIDSKKTDEKIKEWKLKAKKTDRIVKRETLKNMLRWSRDNGALIIAAHPGIPTGRQSVKEKTLGILYKEGLIHGAEIHNNDLERRTHSKKLYNFWHRRASKLVHKIGIPAYVTSDAHSINRLGSYFNMIKTNEPENILNILKLGKIKIRHGKI
ncbi:MAG: CehA/McbA family metallohydrolase [Candidatus Shapirobacteria bacterium]